MDEFSDIVETLEEGRLRDRLAKEDLDEHSPIAGHMCIGLRLFQHLGGGCEPSLNDRGGRVFVNGCDSSNPLPLKFCPFCGAEFKRIAEGADTGF